MKNSVFIICLYLSFSFSAQTISVGTENSMFLCVNEGLVVVLGNNSAGQQTYQFEDFKYFRKVNGLSGIIQIQNADHNSFALNGNGELFGWGPNGILLGLGDDSARYEATFIRSEVKSVFAKHTNVFLVDNDNRLFAFGENAYGSLGIGNEVAQNSPIPINSIDSVVRVSVGKEHTLALRTDGSVWSWGRNNFGQLGSGSSNSNIPISVAGLSSIKDIAAGRFHSMALDSLGKIWVWGYNGMGQLGDSSLNIESSPVNLTSLSQIKEIESGDFSSYAISDLGTVFSWGTALSIGFDSIISSKTPIEIPGLIDVVDLKAESTHTLALDVNGLFWGWGSEQNWQLGDTTGGIKKVPEQLSFLCEKLSLKDKNLDSKEDRPIFFPNPLDGVLSVYFKMEVDALSMSIINFLGQEVINYSLEYQPKASMFTFDLSGLIGGRYIIQFVSKNGIYTQALLKL